MKKICGIYKIENCSGSKYIGQSVDIYDRWKCYKKYLAEGQPKLFNSFKKYGSENHTFTILIECERYELDYFEKFYINHYQTFNTTHGMNLQSGGQAGIHSEESKKKIGDALRGIPKSEDAKRNMSKAGAGKVFSQEAKENMSKAKLSLPKESFEYLREVNTGRVHTEETKKKIGEAQVGEKNHMFGKSHSEESKKKLREINTGKKYSEETKEKISRAQKGKPKSEETKQKLREAALLREAVPGYKEKKSQKIRDYYTRKREEKNNGGTGEA